MPTCFCAVLFPMPMRADFTTNTASCFAPVHSNPKTKGKTMRTRQEISLRQAELAQSAARLQKRRLRFMESIERRLALVRLEQTMLAGESMAVAVLEGKELAR